MRIERQNVRDILVRLRNDHAVMVSIDAPRFKNVLLRLQVRAKDRPVVVQAVADLPGKKEARQAFNGDLAMALLHWSGIGQPDDRRGMKAHASQKTFGEMLIG